MQVTAAERAQLMTWVRTRTSPHRLVVRSRIVLLAGEGLSTTEIAARLHVTPATVRVWCKRFHRGGLAALVRDAPGRGRRPGMSRTAVISVLRILETYAQSRQAWTVREIAARAGTSAATVSRICKRIEIGRSSSAADINRALLKAISETRGNEE